jgi:hypothetical protein
MTVFTSFKEKSAVFRWLDTIADQLTFYCVANLRCITKRIDVGVYEVVSAFSY